MTMRHYFIFGQDFAAVEDATQAAKYAAAGWEEVSEAMFTRAWRERDAARQAELKRSAAAWIQSLPWAERRRRGI